MWTIVNDVIINTEIPDMLEYLCEPYPYAIFHYTNNDITNELIPEMIETFSEPLPISIWYIDGTDIKHYSIPDMVPIFTPPYPLGAFIYNDNNIDCYLLPECDNLGAFANTFLRSISIPYCTITYGDYAFSNTPVLDNIEIPIISEFNEDTTFDAHTNITYKPIHYFRSYKLDDLYDTNNRIFFGNSETGSDKTYTSANAKIRLREPVNKTQ